MGKVQLPKLAKEGIKRAIKAGVKGETPSVVKGTLRGGVISPLLANLAIGNLEDIAAKYYIRPNGKVENMGVTGIRYADDMVFITNTKSEAGKLLNRITEYLNERGLRVKEAKTGITKATEGFIFRKIRREIGKAAGKVTKKIKSRLRRNRNLGNTNENLNCIRKREAAVQLVKKAFPYVPYKLFGHVKVRFDKSPFDGDLVYWTRRKYKEYAAKSYTGKAITRQGFKCASCNMPLMPGDDIELHHIDGNHHKIWRCGSIKRESSRSETRRGHGSGQNIN